MDPEIKNFYDSLTNAEWDQAEAIEHDIEALLNIGFTEPVHVKFVRTVMEVRKAVPTATVCGVLEAALDFGLSYYGDKRTLARLRSGQFAYEANRIKPKGKGNSSKRGSTLK